MRLKFLDVKLGGGGGGGGNVDSFSVSCDKLCFSGSKVQNCKDARPADHCLGMYLIIYSITKLHFCFHSRLQIQRMCYF